IVTQHFLESSTGIVDTLLRKREACLDNQRQVALGGEVVKPRRMLLHRTEVSRQKLDLRQSGQGAHFIGVRLVSGADARLGELERAQKLCVSFAVAALSQIPERERVVWGEIMRGRGERLIDLRFRTLEIVTALEKRRECNSRLC